MKRVNNAITYSCKYRNPYPGQLFNSPNGSNVYQGLHVDYSGEVGEMYKYII